MSIEQEAADNIYRLLDENTALKARVKELEGTLILQPMSEAPTDGSWVIVYDPEAPPERRYTSARWREGPHGHDEWISSDGPLSPNKRASWILFPHRFRGSDG